MQVSLEKELVRNGFGGLQERLKRLERRGQCCEKEEEVAKRKKGMKVSLMFAHEAVWIALDLHSV